MPREQELFPKTIFCIDASALINLMPRGRDIYRRDVFPTIWNKLEDMIRNGELIASLEVYKEIKAVSDKIYDWCKSNKVMFKDIDECQRQKLQEVEKQYDKNYWKNENNKEVWADPWVMALSLCEDAIIVTDEKNTQNRIPAITSMLGLKCLGLLDFFKKIGIKY
ncbi:MAG: DUF4411 family protein [Nitrospirae bacterium]|nr:DUF4411 family protein [Nitrospirota bacterium]